jgi:predicted enzyme related to lactoylglutathione lyase
MAITRDAPPVEVEHDEAEEGDGLLAEERRVYRVSGVTYLHIPARDEHEASRFFQSVFGWNLRGDPEHPSFDDGTGHVLGTWVTYRQPAPDAGILPYIFVESLDETLDKVCAHGGAIRSLPFQDGDLWVATFTDPSGNAMGLWARKPR